MSAICEVLVGMGHQVSGSDLVGSSALDRLAQLGVPVRVGHRPATIVDCSFVVRSTAVPMDDPEVMAALSVGIPILRRSEVLAGICGQRRTAAVSGTHGKTTTTALLAAALGGAGLRPSWIVGAELRGLGSGGRWDDGDWLAVEADESDGTFLELPAELVVVTNVEADHLDHYGDFSGLVAAFERFLAGASGVSVVCADDQISAELGVRTGAISYGVSPVADYRIGAVRGHRSSIEFTLAHDGRDICEVVVPLPGLHNARNAAGAITAAVNLGVDPEVAAAGVGVAPAVARRFERRGERDGITFVDDYAHLPGEVAAALDAARAGGWSRVICVFQPHRFSRTLALAADFGPVLGAADLLWVTDVYAAGEPRLPGVSGVLVADEVRRVHRALAVVYQPDRRTLIEEVRSALRSGDLCLTLGAGDITTLADDLLRVE